LIAPLYLLASTVLAVGAALGLTTSLFQDVLGHDGLIFYVPFAAAVLLVALGSDYTIFSVGYIWDQARHRSLRQALAVAVPRSTRAITVAGVTLAASFALAALIPLAPFYELAFIMAVGVLIDAFIVRSLLIPALISVVGRTSGWPGKRLILPRIELPRPDGDSLS
jgi:RND superfamily putative drug exporter